MYKIMAALLRSGRGVHGNYHDLFGLPVTIDKSDMDLQYGESYVLSNLTHAQGS